MVQYILGYLRNILNKGVGILTIVDANSRISKYSRTNRFVKVVNSIIGRYSYIGCNSWVINCEIGDFCSIADNVRIGLAEHTLSMVSTSPIFTEKNNATGHSWIGRSIKNHTICRVIIGNDVWIGSGVRIKAGLKIGDGAVIGAGAVVTKDVPPYAIVGGIPARIIRYRFSDDVINGLLQLQWWKYPDNVIKENIALFQADDVSIDLLNEFKTR